VTAAQAAARGIEQLQLALVSPRADLRREMLDFARTWFSLAQYKAFTENAGPSGAGASADGSAPSSAG
jgi:hypothetical protein